MKPRTWRSPLRSGSVCYYGNNIRHTHTHSFFVWELKAVSSRRAPHKTEAVWKTIKSQTVQCFVSAAAAAVCVCVCVCDEGLRALKFSHVVIMKI